MLLWKVPGAENLCPPSHREARISHGTSSSRLHASGMDTELLVQDGGRGYPLACVSKGKEPCRAKERRFMEQRYWLPSEGEGYTEPGTQLGGGDRGPLPATCCSVSHFSSFFTKYNIFHKNGGNLSLWG